MKRLEDPCRDPASEERDDWAVESVVAAATPAKERPILFSAPMVRAILGNSKTQTRRIVKPQPATWADVFQPAPVKTSIGFYGKPGDWIQSSADNHHMHGMARCPYGQPGDRLWVREAWRASSAHDDLAPSKIPVGDSVEYLADPERIVTGKGRPSIFLPRWASRITLEITAIRVERLQEISEEDAKAEGVDWTPFFNDPVAAYRDLWESINGPGSWNANPFVWGIEFRRHAS